jgi:hypothetical protein|tara:strand:- start:35 stop:262 length:228 start_codon:yes stop_codon:yes gene_type:complete
MEIVSQTHRGSSIRQDLKRQSTIIEFIQNGEVIKGTFRIDKKRDLGKGPFIGVIDCDTKACWQINTDTVISLAVI